MSTWLSCIFIFVLSFCSLAYELFLAKILSDLSQNEILSQSLGIGLFLLGLGAGAGASSLWPTSAPLRRLFWVECFLISLAFLLVPISYGVGFLQLLTQFAGAGFLYFFLGTLIFGVGFLSGFEFPLLWQEQGEAAQASLPLAVSYLGGLGAGFAVPLLLNPQWGPFKAIIFLGLINGVVAALLILFFDRTSRLKSLHLAGLLLPTAALYLSALFTPALEQAYLKTFYFKVRIPSFETSGIHNIWQGLKLIPPIERWHSPYQKIDLVRTAPEASWAVDPDQGISLYLDRRLQFNERTVKIYHESMTEGAFNLAQQIPKNILILGGGDGLLITELLKHPEIERIDLVEIDPKMIELARTEYGFLRLNERSLENPRVHIHVADGFAFMKRQKPGQFDAVFIDFPYPHSPDLLRLYSVEFYKIVRRALTDSGFAIMDGPFYVEEELESLGTAPPPQWVIRDTLHAAGFAEIFVFGNFEGFYFFKKDNGKVSFDYPRLPSTLSNPALVNLQNMTPFMAGGEDRPRVNSLFKPFPVLPSF